MTRILDTRIFEPGYRAPGAASKGGPSRGATVVRRTRLGATTTSYVLLRLILVMVLAGQET